MLSSTLITVPGSSRKLTAWMYKIGSGAYSAAEDVRNPIVISSAMRCVFDQFKDNPKFA
jgi:hypothetical protein